MRRVGRDALAAAFGTAKVSFISYGIPDRSYRIAMIERIFQGDAHSVGARRLCSLERIVSAPPLALLNSDVIRMERQLCPS